MTDMVIWVVADAPLCHVKLIGSSHWSIRNNVIEATWRLP